MPDRPGHPRRARGAARARTARPRIAELPPLHGGVVGYLGYDVVREVERLPDVPADDLGLPDAVLSVIGQLAAFDHFRQRRHLIENVFVAAGRRRRRRSTTPTTPPSRRLDALVADAAPGRCRTRRSPPPEPRSTELPEVHVARCGRRRTSGAVEAAKEHILAGDIFQVVLAQRFDLELDADPFDVYRVLRQVNPSRTCTSCAIPRSTLVGSSPEPMVQLLDGRVISPPDRRHPPPGPHRRATTAAWRPS